MKKTFKIVSFIILATVVALLLTQCNSGQTGAETPNQWADDPNHCEPPSWIPDTLCNGRPALESWTRTDEYRLKTGDMFFEWEYYESGDSCLFAIVVRLPNGTIDNLLKSAQ